MTYLSALFASLRRFAPLLLILLFVACDSAEPQRDTGRFSATLRGPVPSDMSGEAKFGKMTAFAFVFQMETFAISLDEGSRRGRKIFISRNDTTAPAPGTYALLNAVAPRTEQPDSSRFHAFAILDGEYVYSTEGELVITSDDSDRLIGTFSFTAESAPSRTEDEPAITGPITIEGEFDARPR